MRSLESKLTAQFGDELDTPLRAVSTARLDMRGLIIWIVAGVTGGLVAHLAFGIGSQAVMQGLGVGLAMVIAMPILDRAAREDRSQPGGFYVVLGVTETHLIVFGRSLWAPSSFDIAGRTPLEEIQSIRAERRWPGQRIDIALPTGGHWRFEVTRWNKLSKALPARLLG